VTRRVETCRDVSRRVALVELHCATRSSRARQARLARHVFRSVATALTGVDMSTSRFPEVVPETDANPEHKRLNLYIRAMLLLRRPPCWNKHDSITLDTLFTTRSTRLTRRTCRVVSRRDVTSQVEFSLKP